MRPDFQKWKEQETGALHLLPTLEWVVDAGVSRVQGQHHQQSELTASQGYVRHCLKKTKQKSGKKKRAENMEN